MRKSETIKTYLKWMVETHDNLIPYDACFKKGNDTFHIIANPGVHDYAFWYITPYLLINIYEFFTLFWRFKYETNQKYVVNEKQLKQKLLSKFGIDYDVETYDIKQKIVNCDIFVKKHISKIYPEGILYYEILNKARNMICHSDFYSSIPQLVDGMNFCETFIDIIRNIIK